MATQRYISTSFWDDEWVQEHDPSEKLFYLYLLTNPLTNIAGVYKITDKRVSFDTGFNREVVAEMWRRFEGAQKVYRRGEWVVIPSWPKHQKWDQRSKIKQGIDKVLVSVPKALFDELHSIGYAYDIDTLSYPTVTYGYPSNYLDPDLELDGNRDTDRDIDTTPDNSVWPAETKICRAAWQSFRKYYASLLPHPHKQIDAMNQIIGMATQRGDPHAIVLGMMKKLKELKDEDGTPKGFWRKQPYLPTTLVSLWARVWEEAKLEAQDDKDLEDLFDDNK